VPDTVVEHAEPCVPGRLTPGIMRAVNPDDRRVRLAVGQTADQAPMARGAVGEQPVTDG
jgi:hypothetical protein